jgi:hypothetical protein
MCLAVKQNIKTPQLLTKRFRNEEQMERKGKLRVHLCVLMWTLALQSARGADFLEIGVSSATSQRGVNFGTAVELMSRAGVNASQVIGFGIGRSPVSFLLEGSFTFNQYSGENLNVVEPNAAAYGGGLGFQFGRHTLVLRMMGGIKNSFIVTQPATNSYTMTPIMSPQVWGSLKWIPLEGRGHEVGFGALGAYQLTGNDSTSGASLTSAASIGAEIFLDFSRGQFPMALFGNIISTTIQSSAGNQTNLVFGGGLRFGASVSKPARAENK